MATDDAMELLTEEELDIEIEKDKAFIKTSTEYGYSSDSPEVQHHLHLLLQARIAVRLYKAVKGIDRWIGGYPENESEWADLARGDKALTSVMASVRLKE